MEEVEYKVWIVEWDRHRSQIAVEDEQSSMGAGRWRLTSMMTIGHGDMIKIGMRRFACEAKDYVTSSKASRANVRVLRSVSETFTSRQVSS